MSRLLKHLALLLPLCATTNLFAADNNCPEESIFWNDTCFTSKHGQTFVKPAFLKNLDHNQHGFAVVWKDQNDLFVAVNKKGRVVRTGIYRFDNGPDYFKHGLARFVAQGKCGYVNTQYQIVIPATFDGCMPFEGKYADVCMDCKSLCEEDGCEHSYYDGGTWSKISTSGKVHPMPSNPVNDEPIHLNVDTP